MATESVQMLEIWGLCAELADAYQSIMILIVGCIVALERFGETYTQHVSDS